MGENLCITGMHTAYTSPGSDHEPIKARPSWKPGSPGMPFHPIVGLLSSRLKVKTGGDETSSFVEEETDWSDWNTIKEYNISGTGGKQERTMQFTVPQEKGWEVFTEIESEETIIPRTIKITKAPHKEETIQKSRAEVKVDRRVTRTTPEKEEDDEYEKPTEAKQTKKPKEEDDDEGPGKKIGEEVSIKLPKQVWKSSNLHYSSLYNLLLIPLSLICV
ncbi:unnamed protein product [Schistosoma curassoni]|uniref:SHSP domain-containing protein n=1 Tax=Schistosoma curassoni TaxID=6186 RepID=A0A183JWT7_9TREM|nr:unnamed protein product [Schistosoma curassoni]